MRSSVPLPHSPGKEGRRTVSSSSMKMVLFVHPRKTTWSEGIVGPHPKAMHIRHATTTDAVVHAMTMRTRRTRVLHM